MKKKSKWIKIPEKSLEAWFGEWLCSSMVVRAHAKFGKLPKYIRLPTGFIKEQKDGSGLLNYEVK
jgi:hypothetical protein